MKTKILPVFLFSLFTAGALEAAPMLQQWQWRNPLPQGNDLHALAHANDRFVAVGDYGTILSSADGVQWTLHSLETGASIKGLAYGNGTFVAVGQRYPSQTNFSSGLDFILTSVDGTNWTERPTGEDNLLKSVAFGNGQFVAVGSSWPYTWPYIDFILTSPDGVAWTPRNVATNTGLSKVSFGGGRFLAVGNTDVVQTSVDGINWDWRPFGAGGNLQNVTFGAGSWLAVGYIYTNSAYAPFITSSPDATHWTVRHIGAPQPGVYSPLLAVSYGNGRFVAMGTQYFDSESNVTLFSEDGLTWERAPDLLMLQRPTALLHAAGQFVAVGEFGNISTSPDGSAWTGRSRATSNNLRGLAYGNGTFVTVGNNGTNLTSANGTFWTGHNSVTANNLREVTYAADQFVAVGSDGTILTSPNGANWTVQTSGTTEDLWDVAYGNGTFVTVGGDSGGSDNNYHRFSILTSSDGTNWTTRLADPNYSYFSFELHAVTYGNGRFVAIGRPGAILTSIDGITWRTNLIVPEPRAYLKGLAYGNGLFVAVGETTNAWTSTDGSHWVLHPLPVPIFAQLDDVAFGDGAFVAVGDVGLILTSVDGVEWSAPHSRTTTNLRDVAYGAGSFVIVGNNDHILQSGTNATPAVFAIVEQPSNQVVRPGAFVTFHALAQGTGPFTYQWRRNGAYIFGATEPSLSIANVQIADSAYYTVVVSDGTNSLTSDSAFLVVTPTDPLDTWSIRVPQLASPVYAVTYGADRFVAVGESAAWTSIDGAVWAVNTPPVLNLQGVTFGNGLFVACSRGIATSINGSNWTARPSGTSNALTAVSWGNGNFVAVGAESAGGSFATTSPDGVTWTPAPLPANTGLLDVDFGNGQFVAVGYNGRVLTSPDGRNWTLRNSGTNATLYGVVHGNGQFVAVGWPRLILTSPNAVNWIPRTNPAPPTVVLLGLTYGHGRFVASDYNGATLSSPDGVSWTLHPALPGVTLRNLAAGPDGFVAVGGMIVQSAPLVPTPPYILTQPRSKVPLVGASYTLNVSASGMPPPAYQWRRNGVAIPGATSSNYTITSVQITNEGSYSVDVANPFGSVTSAPAEVVAGVPATFLQSPLSQDVVAGGSVTLSAVVTGRPPPFTYIWRYEGFQGPLLRVTNISSEPLTFHTYVAPSISATQRFRVVVTNEVTIGPGTISEYATVRVLADSDGDGLPDAWESTFGFNPKSAGDGTNDFDLDGLSNAAEYIAGTNPTNATSVLRFESVESHGAAARLRFMAVANKTYTVQAKPVLDASPWQRVADVAATASDRTVEIQDPFGAGGVSRFYRLVTPRAP